MPVQMELKRIIISEIHDQQVIMLKEVEGDRASPSLSASSKQPASTGRGRGCGGFATAHAAFGRSGAAASSAALLERQLFGSRSLGIFAFFLLSVMYGP